MDVKYRMKSSISFIWFGWLILVILWNFSFPKATPTEDVIVAVFLSLIFFKFKNEK